METIAASCHCGAVHIFVDGLLTEVTDCNCSICRSYGVLWAYYSPGQVSFELTGPTNIYTWGDKLLEFHRCAHCGCVTHWTAVDRSVQRMAVNARLMPTSIRAAAKIKRLDGADSWTYIDE